MKPLKIDITDKVFRATCECGGKIIENIDDLETKGVIKCQNTECLKEYIIPPLNNKK